MANLSKSGIAPLIGGPVAIRLQMTVQIPI